MKSTPNRRLNSRVNKVPGRRSKIKSAMARVRLFSALLSIITMLFLIFLFYRWLNHPFISQTVGISTVLSRTLLFSIIAVSSILSVMVSLSLSHWVVRLDWSRILAYELESMDRLLYRVSCALQEGRWDVKNRYWSLRLGYSQLFLWKPILLFTAGLAGILILCRSADSLPGFWQLVSGEYDPSPIDYLIRAVDAGFDELLKGLIENFIWRVDLIIGG